MAELSETTGVPVPTIKYYIREGLLEPGRTAAPNQADYGQDHVRRLKLVRALVEYGGLSLSAIHDLITRADHPGQEMCDLLATAQKAVTQPKDARPGQARDKARERLLGLARTRGWRVRQDDPAFRTAVGVLAILDEVGHQDMIGLLDVYADVAEKIAEADLRLLGGVAGREDAVEVAVIATSVGDTLIGSLRRLAQTTTAQRMETNENSGGG
ncbi:MerR family transcriptional regulator [Nonomuraea sp. NPDC050404]|uniref:MerR family transcriptional regulator n=1 Tax=Nonomuraea sp. NPDC050404 TaxID=3155783 RepID=UPI0033D2A653